VDGAPSLHHVHGIAVAVADPWTGDTMAERRTRLIATLGRPAASLKDGGSARHNAVDGLAAHGLASPCIDDRAPAAAGMLQRSDPHHPAFERVVSACGRVAGTLTHTLLACVAPPTVRPKARVLPGHRLVTWAERLRQLAPPGGAKAGSPFARLRACRGALPACTDLSTRFRADAHGLLACQRMLHTTGLSHDTLAQGEPLSCAMPTATVRQEWSASLAEQLTTATTVGLEHVGVPISADPIASLFGVAQRHGMGQTQDAARIALRLPALWGAPTRAEAEQVLGGRVARHHDITGQFTSLTTQRREVLGHRKALERLGRRQGKPPVERIPRPKNRSNYEAIVHLSMGCEDQNRPHLLPQQTPCVMENGGPPDMREAALT
jgi:hypothetical protein